MQLISDYSVKQYGTDQSMCDWETCTQADVIFTLRLPHCTALISQWLWGKCQSPHPYQYQQNWTTALPPTVDTFQFYTTTDHITSQCPIFPHKDNAAAKKNRDTPKMVDRSPRVASLIQNGLLCMHVFTAPPKLYYWLEDWLTEESAHLGLNIWPKGYPKNMHITPALCG